MLFRSKAAHVVVAQAAELRADDLVLADFRGGEMNRDRQAGDGVLLQAQFANIEIVDYVLRVKDQFDLVIYWNRESGNYDVIFSGWIIGIQAERIAGGCADLLGVEPAEFSVGAGIAEIEGELVGGDFYLDGVWFGRGEAGFAPGLAAEQAQTYEQNDCG